MPQTWNESAESAIDAIFSLVIKRKDKSPAMIRKYLDGFIESLYDRRGGNIQACVFFSQIGAEAIEVARLRELDLNKKECVNILVSKQKDYGPEAITRFGRQGLLVRIHDKVARLENLDGDGRQPNHEAMQDTFLDLVNYCALGIMVERREFNLPII